MRGAERWESDRLCRVPGGEIEKGCAGCCAGCRTVGERQAVRGAGWWESDRLVGGAGQWESERLCGCRNMGERQALPGAGVVFGVPSSP